LPFREQEGTLKLILEVYRVDGKPDMMFERALFWVALQLSRPPLSASWHLPAWSLHGEGFHFLPS
jgi:hypothetical protein